MMTGELFLLAWILDATLAEGGRVMGRGDLGYNITRQLHRFHVYRSKRSSYILSKTD